MTKKTSPTNSDDASINFHSQLWKLLDQSKESMKKSHECGAMWITPGASQG